MGLLGDFAKDLVIMVGVFWVIPIFEFISMGQIEMALLLLLTLLIPLSMIGYDYWKNKRKGRTQ